METREPQEMLMGRLASGPTPEEAVQFIDQLENFLTKLQPIERQILELRMEGHNNLEIAEKLGISDRKIRRLMERIRGLAENLGMKAVDAVHRRADVGPRRLNQQVVVVSHQAVRVADQFLPFARERHESEERLPILVTEVDVLAYVASRGDVIQDPRTLIARLSTHDATVRLEPSRVCHDMYRSPRQNETTGPRPDVSSVKQMDQVPVFHP